MLPRIALSTGVHICLAILAVAVIWLLTKGDASLVPALRDRLFNDPDTLGRVRSDAVGHMMLWAALSLAGSFLLSSLWVSIAERTMPIDDHQARSRSGSWAGILLLLVFWFFVIGFIQIWRTSTHLDMNLKTIVIGGLITLTLTCLAYYAGTFVAVKRAMRPSVPFAPVV